MTPIMDPECLAEEKFNESHSKTRVVIENAFGYWQRRFHCVSHKSEYQPEFLAKIVIAMVCLHNLAMRKGDLWLDDGHVYDLPETIELRHEAEDDCPYDDYIDLRNFPSGKDVRGIIVAGTFGD